ncbi:hypothetical protein C4K35_1913 [Pseudomonas chlororaphis subsp. piscium]|nr:hypothetical protein C4K35_1913 [Pseudomonas chlororaphis subsp. piscium]
MTPAEEWLYANNEWLGALLLILILLIPCRK